MIKVLPHSFYTIILPLSIQSITVSSVEVLLFSEELIKHSCVSCVSNWQSLALLLPEFESGWHGSRNDCFSHSQLALESAFLTAWSFSSLIINVAKTKNVVYKEVVSTQTEQKETIE